MMIQRSGKWKGSILGKCEGTGSRTQEEGLVLESQGESTHQGAAKGAQMPHATWQAEPE